MKNYENIKPEYFIKVVGGITIVVFGYQLLKESKSLFTIKGRLNCKHIEIQSLPENLIENLDYNNTEISKDLKPNEIVIHFYNTIKEKLPYVNLTIYNSNIKSLKILRVSKIKKKNSEANYNISKNKITVLKSTNNKKIAHEMLHVSSEFKVGNSIFGGFSQFHENMPFRLFGEGLTEGYTTLLDCRYFEGDNYCSTYEALSIIAHILELIVGKEKMEKFYFEADLYNLIQSLKQYNSRSNIFKFINDLDILLYCTGNTVTEKHYSKKSLQNISKFLIKTYATKTLNLKYNNQINEKEMWNRISNLIDVLDNVVTLNSGTYKFSNVNTLYEEVSKLTHIEKEEIKLKTKRSETNV